MALSQEVFDTVDKRSGDASLASYRSRPIDSVADGSRSTISLGLISVAVAIADVAMVIGAAFAVKALNGNLYVMLDAQRYGSLSFVAGPLACIILRQLGLYDMERLLRPLRQLGLLCFGLALAFLVLIAVLFMVKPSAAYSSGGIVGWFFASFALLSLARLVAGRYLNRLRNDGELSQRVAIYGKGQLGRRVFSILDREWPDIEVVGVFDDNVSTSKGFKLKLAGGLDDLVSCVMRTGCSRVIIALPLTNQSRIKRLIRKFSPFSVDVQLCTEVCDRAHNSWASNSMSDIRYLQVQSRPMSDDDILLKSVLEFVLVGTALVFLAPLFLLLAAAIKLDSKGPVLFTQKRHGYNNQVFRLFKFRTMNVMEDGKRIKQATNGDARVTRVGRFLRRTSLDEIPQIINVIRGEMSLVGPRPHALAHSDFYGSIISEYAIRQRVKPGISGWAQINGFRGETDDPELMRRRVEHDLEYIKNWSIGLDLEILIRTVPAILSGKNAY